MVFDGNIAWPPTRTVGSDIDCAKAGDCARAGVAASSTAANRVARFMLISSVGLGGRCGPLSFIRAGRAVGCRAAIIFVAGRRSCGNGAMALEGDGGG